MEPIKRVPEPGPEVAAVLEKYPGLKELTLRYSGYDYPNSLYNFTQEKFTPRLARELVGAMFDTDAEQLEYQGVENWADFLCYLLNQWRWFSQFQGSGFEKELDEYSEAKTRDWQAAERKRRYSRKKKPK